MIVLLLTFGSVVAMGLPIITAIVGLVAGLSIVAVLGQSVEVPDDGAGAGDDDRARRRDRLRLFVVTRHRDQLASGMELRESIARDDRDVGRRRGVRRQHGDHRAAVARGRRASRSSRTLGLHLGDRRARRGDSRRSRCCRRSSPRRRAGQRAARYPECRPHHDDAPARLAALGRGSSPTTRGRRVVAGVLILLVLALPLRHLHLGQTNVAAADRHEPQAYDRQGLRAGSNGPLLIAVDDAAGDQRPEADRLGQQQQSDAKAKSQKQAQISQAARRS